MDIKVQHNKEDQEFTADIPGGEAELAYSLPEKNVIDFQHTYVSENLRGKGVAEELVKTGLEYARDNKFKVIATCQFVASYVRRHKAEYESLLAN
jgi:predicted GNAT family acetyltransferase